MGYLGLEPRTYRLKAEYSTIELVTLILTYFFYFVVTPVTSVFTSVSFYLLAIALEFLPVGIVSICEAYAGVTNRQSLRLPAEIATTK